MLVTRDAEAQRHQPPAVARNWKRNVRHPFVDFAPAADEANRLEPAPEHGPAPGRKLAALVEPRPLAAVALVAPRVALRQLAPAALVGVEPAAALGGRTAEYSSAEERKRVFVYHFATRRFSPNRQIKDDHNLFRNLKNARLIWVRRRSVCELLRRYRDKDHRTSDALGN